MRCARSKKRMQYEDDVAREPLNYDTWFDYIRLEEQGGDPARIRGVFERAVAQLPPANEKRLWLRYIYLWIYYAVYEELEAGDVERERAVYRACLQVVPHKVFTFGKVWVMAAEFEVRQRDLSTARKILGRAIGMCPKAKVFEAYIDMEIRLGNVERCRNLYEKFLSWDPTRVSSWCHLAELEADLEEMARARGVYEVAIAQVRGVTRAEHRPSRGTWFAGQTPVHMARSWGCGGAAQARGALCYVTFNA